MTRPENRTITTKPGRPGSYTPDLAAAICSQLAEGQSLAAVCRDPAMPSRATVMRWLDQDEDFRRAYVEAKRIMLEAEAEKMLEIADDESIDPQSRRVMLDARKWILAKLLPKKYGDRPEEPIEKMDIKVTIGGNAPGCQ